MNTGDRNGAPGYSADYRGIHPPKPKAKKSIPKNPPPHVPAGKASPKGGRPAGRRPEPEEEPVLPESSCEEELLTRWDADDGPAAPLREARPRRRGKYRYGIFAGAAVLLLALVGVGFIAAQIGARVRGALTDDSRLRAYDRFLTVAVAQDPQPFASPEKADPEFVLNASLWKAMTENSDSYTSYDDAGRAIVPLGDVAEACRELFGPDCRLQPKNPAEETFYEYDASGNRFYVSLFSLDSVYAPYTQSARREGDATVLRVGYVPPTDETRLQTASAPAASGGTPTPAKVMEYVMKTDPSSRKEYLYAVRKPS